MWGVRGASVCINLLGCIVDECFSIEASSRKASASPSIKTKYIERSSWIKQVIVANTKEIRMAATNGKAKETAITFAIVATARSISVQPHLFKSSSHWRMPMILIHATQISVFGTL